MGSCQKEAIKCAGNVKLHVKNPIGTFAYYLMLPGATR